MKATIKTQVTIAASPTEVFKYLTNLRFHYLWNPQVHRISTHEQLKQGSVFESVSRVLGVEVRAVNRVTKFTPQEEFQLENTMGVVQYHAAFHLFAKYQSTLLVCTMTVASASKGFAFSALILKKLAQRELQTDMQALKVAVESHLE
jgi:hypothetical protein